MAALPLPARSAGTEGYDVWLLGRRRKRIAELRAAAEQATAERQLSERRLRSMQTQIVEPRMQTAGRNHYADIIRRSLHPDGH